MIRGLLLIALVCSIPLSLPIRIPHSALRASLTAAPLRPGAFLVAAPRLNDPNFGKTVVLLVRHGRRGSFGLIINRPAKIKTEEVLPDLKGAQAPPLFFGGPVGRNVLFALVKDEPPPDGAQKILNQVYFVGQREILLPLLQRPKPSRKIRVYAGYSGWGPGQLEREVLRGDWNVIDADEGTIFTEETSEIWQELSRAGEKIQVRGN
jgi:putative transcriptional regulator